MNGIKVFGGLMLVFVIVLTGVFFDTLAGQQRTELTISCQPERALVLIVDNKGVVHNVEHYDSECSAYIDGENVFEGSYYKSVPQSRSEAQQVGKDVLNQLVSNLRDIRNDQ